MDILTTSQAVLRDVGYETWRTTSGEFVCFEDNALLGFIFAFSDAGALLSKYETAQLQVLNEFGAQLRKAGNKAWNVYSIFLTSSVASNAQARLLASIEEDLNRTRKLARAGIIDVVALREALGPLLPLPSVTLYVAEALPSRIRTKLEALPERATNAFLSNTSAKDLAETLSEPDDH